MPFDKPWAKFIDEEGNLIRAVKMTADFRVTDAEGIVTVGEPGDYLTKPADGKRRVVKAKDFERRFKSLE